MNSLLGVKSEMSGYIAKKVLRRVVEALMIISLYINSH